ncbi:carboxymuconolactone decarboxylase family protein [Nocardiopsis alba]|uniref:Carboxymuconolactone decarboxylase-like domain-containing protein n=1 Tax=Nocardiopsis alba (strain ATCC BAA-2165 / BE74) TaxID=1205910 RepID=J7LA82_NOCAA|nr:peroxidase-related enzyme [Nocardiopsis alba]AFR09566.1 hypothetical protein B005_0608 [Nocardiopsis alba ATCC BAA-2165]
MSRVDLVHNKDIRGESAERFARIHETFGVVPNMFKAVANSPAALAGMWGFFGALGEGVLGARIGEQIAVAVADRNRCDYCLSAHTLLGRKAGVTAEELAQAQKGTSHDPRTAAILALATALVDHRGQVEAEVISDAREAGLTQEEIVETIAHVALNLFTNYVNVALDVPVDFDRVPLTGA